MLTGRRPWQEELAIIDRTMKAISGVTDPEELVEIYWNGIGELIADRRLRLGLSPPGTSSRRIYLITRSSRFTEHFNPWTQRDRLPAMCGRAAGRDRLRQQAGHHRRSAGASLSADDPG